MLTARTFRPGDEFVAFRPEDEAECLAASGDSCAQSIAQAAQSGQVVTVGVDPNDTPVLFFGIAAVQPPHAGAVWMLATPSLIQHTKQFVREAPAWLSRLHAQFPLLMNCVDARNTLHIRWLKRMGFRFLKLHPHWGAEQRPFYEFAKLSHV